MNFSQTYTKEQEEFRKEIRAWLEENAKTPPELMPWPRTESQVDHRSLTRAQWEWSKQLARKLGEKGWLWPVWPKEYGGAGLTVDEDIVIKEELRRVGAPSLYNPGASIATPAIWNYGTEEQKKRFIPPMLRAETITWQLWTEPRGGSDLAGTNTRAVKDGDDFIITGEKAWVGAELWSGATPSWQLPGGTCTEGPDYLWTIAVTDPDAPRHANLGAFLIPATLPGISYYDIDLVERAWKHRVVFDNVRVSREYLVGGETSGWRVAQSSMEIEHGAAGRLVSADEMAGGKEVLRRAAALRRRGESLTHDHDAQQDLMDAYIASNIHRLLGLRNYWMFNAVQPRTYEGSQLQNMGRSTRETLAWRMLDALGPYATCNDENWAFDDGELERQMRYAPHSRHGGGTYNTDRIILARRIGISRTQDRAAPAGPREGWGAQQG